MATPLKRGFILWNDGVYGMLTKMSTLYSPRHYFLKVINQESDMILQGIALEIVGEYLTVI